MNERMERGFKAYATRLALDVRAELGLAALEPLDPCLLANHLGIGIDGVSSFRDEAPRSRVFGGSERAAFSAVTVLDGPRRRIVVNDFHSLSRQTNSIAHELSHGLLMHPPAPPFDPRTTPPSSLFCSLTRNWSLRASSTSWNEACAMASRSCGGR
jgi:IrrE N-terminal-like domain